MRVAQQFLLGLGLVLALSACAGRAAIVEGPAARARRTMDGFREASPAVAEVLEDAAAWAVFHGVEDDDGEWVADGLLFAGDAEPRPVVLRARSSEPAAPARMTYHTLIVLADASDVALLDSGGLDLGDAQELTPHDGHAALRPGARRWIVTTARGGLLFPTRATRHALELPAEH